MIQPRLEVAEIFRSYQETFFEKYGTSTSSEQRRVFEDICNCRTAALGGHKIQCDQCGHEDFSYNSCRNRHCPKCQAAARAEWLEDRSEDLLQTHYFHVVFTLPDCLGPIALQNRRLIYGLIFRAASETLLTIAKDPKHLGAEIGFLMVLHTWGQNLHLHPHVHCVVPGGGISLDGSRWIHCRKNFFLPVRVLSRLFKSKFLAYLKAKFEDGELEFHGHLNNLSQPSTNWGQFIKILYGKEWVVYSKPPFGGPRQVLKYLAKYTHRVAISNQRLISLEDGRVTFRWKNYAKGNRQRAMSLDAHEFIRRFILHVLPKGFQRIRQYGFLANRLREKKLELCRSLIGLKSTPNLPAVESNSELGMEGSSKEKGRLCPICKKGQMILIAEVGPVEEQKVRLVLKMNSS